MRFLDDLNPRPEAVNYKPDALNPKPEASDLVSMVLNQDKTLTQQNLTAVVETGGGGGGYGGQTGCRV